MKTYQTYSQMRAIAAPIIPATVSQTKLRASENANRAAAYRQQAPRILADRLAIAWGAR